MATNEIESKIVKEKIPLEESETEQIQTGLQHLENIEHELEQIKERTANPQRTLFNGMIQGAGAIIGSLIAIVALGGILSLLGIIPAFADIAGYLHGMVDRFDIRH